jgi:hypothetical protein
MSTEDKDLKYHLISPGMPEYEMVEDMAKLIREYDIKNTALEEQYRQGAKELNDEYQPKFEELRRKVFALLHRRPGGERHCRHNRAHDEVLQRHGCRHRGSERRRPGIYLAARARIHAPAREGVTCQLKAIARSMNRTTSGMRTRGTSRRGG